MNFWVGLTLLFVFAGIGAKVLDLWLRPTTKREIHKKILNLWYALGESDPRVVIQAPIRAIAKGLRELYGEALFSSLALRRCTSVTLVVFACALVISAVETGPPFSLDDLPWRNFDKTFNAIETICKNEKGLKDQKPEVQAIQVRACQRIRAYNNLENRIAYSVLFFPLIVAVAVALNFASMTFTRQALAEMADAKSLVTLFSLALGNVFVSICVFIVGLSLICVIATPFSWLVVWALLACGHYLSWLLAWALLLPSVIIALFLSPTWIKVLASVIIVFGLVALLVSLASLLIFPFRKPLRWFLVELLDRAVSSEKGFVAFCGILLASLGAVAVEIVKLISGRGLL